MQLKLEEENKPEVKERKFEVDELHNCALSQIKKGHRFTKTYNLFEDSLTDKFEVTLRTLLDSELKSLNDRVHEISLMGSKTIARTYIPTVDNDGNPISIPQDSEVYSHLDNERAYRRARLSMYIESIGAEKIPDDLKDIYQREEYISQYNPTLLDTIFENCLMAFFDLLQQSFKKFKVF